MQFEEFVQCPICLDRIKNPKLLPCQHSYCLDPCLRGLAASNEGHRLKCPECRAEHQIPTNGVDSFPTNLTLVRFLDMASKINKTDSKDETETESEVKHEDEPIALQESVVPVTFSKLETPDELEYTWFPAGLNGVVFTVRAPHDAHLALSSTDSETDPMLEVFIGGWVNTKSVIRKNRTKPDVVEVETPKILNENQFRGFWIRWTKLFLTVGREGEAAFMSYEIDEPFPIRFVGVCTGWGATGTWSIETPQIVLSPSDELRSMTISVPNFANSAPIGFSVFETPDKLEYKWVPAGTNGVVFRVRAPHDAHLALCSTDSESDPMLEVFIGGWKNTKSVIRKNRTKPDVVEVETPFILYEEEYRGFWIWWIDNVLAVGREGDSNEFMSYGITEPFPINFVGVCTGWGASGSWRIQTLRENAEN